MFHRFKEFFIPSYMGSSIKEYVEHGIIPGRFLTAIICNNLKEAVMYADETNMANLPAFVDYFYNHVPSNIWGSGEAMAWHAGNMAEKRKAERDGK